MKNTHNMLSQGITIANRYEIQFHTGSSSFAQSYRAKDRNCGGLVSIDLINSASLSSIFFNENNKLLHASLLQNIQHPNIISLKKTGEIIIDKQKFIYLVYEFISGETLTEKLKREGPFSVYEAIPIVVELLEAIEYLHNLTEPVIHNGILPDSVMLDLSEGREKPILLGFEQARVINDSSQNISIKNLSFFHAAPELLHNTFIPQSDLFSVGALLYHLIFGTAPWYKENIINQTTNNIRRLLEQERDKKLLFEFADENEIDEHIINTLVKSLSIDARDRFQTASEFVKALKREMVLASGQTNLVPKPIKAKGNGFDAIAGMDELKEILNRDVIRALNEKERYAQYGITIPNGMLLYGPPGCGKTFIAQKFAEEVGYNYIEIKPSDLQSKWINATQENIGKMFRDAEKNQPTIIFIDELDALVPSRENDLHQMHASAVNEFLAQMTNCGTRGIFVVGATNRPEKIDSAILRTGRLDKSIYLSPPDTTARATMFELYLKPRPIDLIMDYEKLANLTENYVSSDIKFIVDEASRQALEVNDRISMQILENVINENPPSVTLEEIRKYELIKQDWENKKKNFKHKRHPIGFKPNN
jgi:transitional endoplasmic reticulum ATPase